MWSVVMRYEMYEVWRCEVKWSVKCEECEGCEEVWSVRCVSVKM
jgi:hypothetical protein